MISSKTNERIKWVRRLQSDKRFRNREETFIAEGNRWLEEVVLSGLEPRFVFATQAWLETAANKLLIGKLPYIPTAVSDQVMAHASSLESPPGVLAALPIPSNPPLDNLLLLLILDAISNPGNLGSILRTAFAAGADGAVLAPGCVDAFNPKVVRGGMGVQLQLPIIQADWPQIRNLVDNLDVWLAAPHGAIPYSEVNWQLPSALVIGSEARGYSQEAKALGASRVSIPMKPGIESLNAAVASGIILFEAARQRAASIDQA